MQAWSLKKYLALFCFFEIRYCYVLEAGFELSMYPKLAKSTTQKYDVRIAAISYIKCALDAYILSNRVITVDFYVILFSPWSSIAKQIIKMSSEVPLFKLY